MIQEDIDLLYKDLCARLPYKVKVTGIQRSNAGIVKTIVYDVLNVQMLCIDDWNKTVHYGKQYWYTDIKPYLRPLSSMTKEERVELFRIGVYIDKTDCDIIFDAYDYRNISLLYTVTPYIEWLNQHHFDYRGLINKGLAIEAPDNMY